MRPANERRPYHVTSSLIGWAHTQNDTLFSGGQPPSLGNTSQLWWDWNRLEKHTCPQIICCSDCLSALKGNPGSYRQRLWYIFLYSECLIFCGIFLMYKAPHISAMRVRYGMTFMSLICIMTALVLCRGVLCKANSLVEFTHKGPIMASFDILFGVSLNKLLYKQLSVSDLIHHDAHGMSLVWYILWWFLQ